MLMQQEHAGTRYNKDKKREKDTKSSKKPQSDVSDVTRCAFSARSRDPLQKPATETFEQLRWMSSLPEVTGLDVLVSLIL